MKKRKNNYIYKNFLIAIEDLMKLKTYFFFSLTLLILSSIIGLLFPEFFKEQIIGLIRTLIDKTEGLSTIQLISFITANNMQVGFFIMILGTIFGIVPVLALIVNGYVLGFVINSSIAAEGILVIWRLIPHGIFEIPAILISTALGMKIGTNLTKFKQSLIEALRIFILIVVPLLVIAGIIEGLLISFL